MIRLTYVGHAKTGMDKEEYRRYWLEHHGPLVAKNAAALHVRRYVQNHPVAPEANEMARQSRGLMEPYDGVAELWWDSIEDLVAAGQTAEGQRASQELYEDECNFVDFSRSVSWYAVELPQINPTPENIVAREDSPIVKIFYCFRHLPSLSLEEAQLYWRMNHGPLIRRYARANRIMRYIQVHRLAGFPPDSSPGPRGVMEEPFTGHAELWYDSVELAAANASPQHAAIQQLIKDDEAKFIDFSRSAMWFVKEHVFVDR